MQLRQPKNVVKVTQVFLRYRYCMCMAIHIVYILQFLLSPLVQPQVSEWLPSSFHLVEGQRL